MSPSGSRGLWGNQAFLKPVCHSSFVRTSALSRISLLCFTLAQAFPGSVLETWGCLMAKSRNSSKCDLDVNICWDLKCSCDSSPWEFSFLCLLLFLASELYFFLLYKFSCLFCYRSFPLTCNAGFIGVWILRGCIYVFRKFKFSS